MAACARHLRKQVMFTIGVVWPGSGERSALVGGHGADAPVRRAHLWRSMEEETWFSSASSCRAPVALC